MKQLFSLKFLWKVYAVLITISIILMLINPDLPMKEVILCLTILIVFRQDYTQLVSDQSKEQPSRTPHVNPKLGWLGLLGFLGFSGIPCYLLSGQTFPFLFFCAQNSLSRQRADFMNIRHTLAWNSYSINPLPVETMFSEKLIKAIGIAWL